ncbi:MAG: S8 family serine peptidase [Oscillospiraceae bacterium]|jgi:subtilisin family serine protease|nr:S8 family serine peptidase [Oscillospiraceae bacterium]
MRKFKSMLALLLVFVLVVSCVGNAFAARNVDKTRNFSKVADRSASAQRVDKQTKGFKSETFKLNNSYQYADDEVVRAIVVMEGDAAADVAANGTTRAAEQGKKVAKQHTEFRKAMAASVDFELKYDFTTLLNGMSVEVAYGDLDKIVDMDGVEAVYIANRYAVPITTPAMEGSGVLTGNTALNAAGFDGEGMVIAVLDTGLRVSHEAFQDYGNLGEVSMTQSDLAKAAAPGVYVNAKVPFAYDYADLDTDVMNSDVDGHGTHVSGIAAGYTEAADGAVTFQGAAPAAQILAMKIFSSAEDGGTYSDIYFAALEDAYQMGADVINMSIGADNGFTYDSELEGEVYGNIYEKLNNSGIIMSVSAGNDGSQADNAMNFAGPGYLTADYADYGVVGSPSTYGDNLSIASAENLEYPSYVITVGGESFSYADSSPDLSWLSTFGGQELDYVSVGGYGEPADYTGLNVSGKIAVVNRGSTTFQEKHDAAAAAGAIGMIVVDNQPGTILMAIDTFLIPAVSTVVEARAAFDADTTGKVSVSNEEIIVSNPLGGMMSDFSSWGTTPDLTMKPTMTSVGGNVYSAFPGGDSAYGVMSGTSMAAPNMAGTFAVVLEALEEKGHTDKVKRAELAIDLLESAALILTDVDGYLYSVRKQGAGLANSMTALLTYLDGAYISNPIVELKDDPSKTGVYSFDLELVNDTDADVEYKAAGVAMRDYVIFDEEGNPYNTLTADYMDATIDVSGMIAGSDNNPCYYEDFTDCVDAWYHESVDYAVANGLMNGTSSTTFAPDASLTRGMIVTVLYRAEGSPEVAAPATFTDVPTGQYYSDAVAWAQANNIVNGISATEFAPMDNVTREQLATIMWRYAGSPTATADLSAFTDAASVSGYAVGAVNWAVSEGIINGYTPTSISPKGNATRAQFATIMMRYFGGSYTCGEVEGEAVVVIPANSSKTVTVTVTLSADAKASLDADFENGGFVEGYVEFYNDDVATHATYMGFYGDWTQAPVLEEYDFRDAAPADAYLNVTYPGEGYDYYSLLEVNTDVNYAYSYDSYFGSAYGWAGDNMFVYTDYYEEHIAITNEANTTGTYYYADSVVMLPTLLRNAEEISMTVTDKNTGEVYEDLGYVETYMPKTNFDVDYGYWNTYCAVLFDGYNATTGEYLPDGTVVTLSFDAVLPYKDTVKEDIWSFDVTVDYQAPVLEDIVYDETAQTLTVTASDNEYLQAIYLCDTEYNILGLEGYSSDVKGESFTATFDVSELSGSIYVTALDYATNEIEELINLDGGSTGGGGDELTESGYYIVEDYSVLGGSYAIVGWPYAGTGYDVDDPYLLNSSAVAANAVANGATISEEYYAFSIEDPSYGWAIEAGSDGYYTIMNEDTGKYLALSGTDLAMVDSASANTAKWGIECVYAFEDGLQIASITSAADPDMILLFDEDALEFFVTDDSVALYEDEEYGPVYPSDYYVIFLYEYMEVTGGGEGGGGDDPTPDPSGLVEVDFADIQPDDEVIVTMYAPVTDAEYVMLNNGGTDTYGPAAIFDGNFDSTMTWNVVAVDGGYKLCPAGTTDTWLYTTNANNGMRVGTDVTGNVWTLDATGCYLQATDSVSDVRYLGIYDNNQGDTVATPNFRAYKNTTGNTVDQYVTFYVVAKG